MKTIKPLLAIIAMLTVGFMTLSCDPAKKIILKNKSDKQVQVNWTWEVDSIYKGDTTKIAQTDTFYLGTEKRDRELFFSWGFGNWPKEAINDCVDNEIKSIEIIGDKTHVTLTDKEEIKHFLLKRRGGILKNWIKIRVH